VNAWVAGRLFHSHLIRVLPQECGRLRAVTTLEGDEWMKGSVEDGFPIVEC